MNLHQVNMRSKACQTLSEVVHLTTVAELGIYFWGAMDKIFYCVYEI